MTLDVVDQLPWLGIGAATVVALVIGTIWFSPMALGGYWARHVSAYTGAPAEEISDGAARPTTVGGWALSLLVTAIGLGLISATTGVDRAADGALLGLVLGACVGATFFTWPMIFARMPWQWWAVNSGALVLMLAAMGAVIGATG